MRQSTFERDGYLCVLCKAKGITKPVELHGANHGICDHIKPLSRGGTDEPENRQTICKECDKVKTAAESAHGRGDRTTAKKDYSKQVGSNGWPVDPRHPANATG